MRWNVTRSPDIRGECKVFIRQDQKFFEPEYYIEADILEEYQFIFLNVEGSYLNILFYRKKAT